MGYYVNIVNSNFKKKKKNLKKAYTAMCKLNKETNLKLVEDIQEVIK